MRVTSGRNASILVHRPTRGRACGRLPDTIARRSGAATAPPVAGGGGADAEECIGARSHHRPMSPNQRRSEGGAMRRSPYRLISFSGLALLFACESTPLVPLAPRAPESSRLFDTAPRPLEDAWTLEVTEPYL